MGRRLSLLLLVCSAAACYVGPDDAPHPVIAEDAADEIFAEAAADPAERTQRHAAAGWLDHEGSPIQPWCGAVLVAPDVVMTSARCVDGWDHSFLGFGLGPVDAKVHAIEQIVVQKDVAVEREQALAALRLAEPILDVAPADLATSGERVCDVESVSYLYVLRGEPSERASWLGCLDGSELRASAGVPNCHGDMGTGAFLPDGALAGIAVDAWSEGACVPGHRLATVADNEAFFDQALELSRPPA